MAEVFRYSTTIPPEWIDYNGHMRDAYFGLIFSLAVDALQDEVGLDEAYRKRTGCTIYLVEDHRFYLKEVKLGATVDVDTRILACDAKRFHLHMTLRNQEVTAAVGEYMELHVRQHPTPHAAPMPPAIIERLNSACCAPEIIQSLKIRARAIGL